MTMMNTYTDSLFMVSLLNSLSRRAGSGKIEHRG
jgi:hypothetical protein